MKILCFGDSNTFGYDPRGWFGGRYDNPWPQLLADKTGWNVLNRGENGREIPLYGWNTSEELDFLVIMLGTNDLLQGNSPQTVAKRMEVFLDSIDLEKMQILLIAPPALKRGEWVDSDFLIEASKELSVFYQDLSRRLGVRFANAAQWDVPLAFDGVHFTEDGHSAFAEELYQYLIKEGIQLCFRTR